MPGRSSSVSKESSRGTTEACLSQHAIGSPASTAATQASSAPCVGAGAVASQRETGAHGTRGMNSIRTSAPRVAAVRGTKSSWCSVASVASCALLVTTSSPAASVFIPASVYAFHWTQRAQTTPCPPWDWTVCSPPCQPTLRTSHACCTCSTGGVPTTGVRVEEADTGFHMRENGCAAAP